MLYDFISGAIQLTVSIFLNYKIKIRIIPGSGSKESCRKIFGELNIVTLLSKYIFFIIMLLSVIRFNTTKFNLHGRNTRYGLNLHPPASSLALYQKSTHYTGLKVLNSLPSYIERRQHNANEFKQLV